MRSSSLALVLVLASCAQPAAERTIVAPAPPSVIAADTRFADVVAAIDAIDVEPGRPIDRCLVRSADGTARIVAQLSPAIAPMPEALEGPVADARASDTVRVASRFGVDGERGPYVATFTHHAPPVEGWAIVVVVEADTVFIRSTIESGPRDQGISIERAAERILDATRAAHPLVVVTAGPRVRFGRVVELLTALRAVTAPFALGVAFTSGEELRDRSGRQDPGTDLCAGLTPVSPETPLGTLPTSVVRDAVSSLDDAMRACATDAEPATVARGGRMRVAVRIGPSGATTERCVVTDDIRDAGFRACILAAVSSHAWPTPTPAGVVDLVFPLVLRRSNDADHAAVCD